MNTASTMIAPVPVIANGPSLKLAMNAIPMTMPGMT